MNNKFITIYRALLPISMIALAVVGIIMMFAGQNCIAINCILVSWLISIEIVDYKRQEHLEGIEYMLDDVFDLLDMQMDLNDKQAQLNSKTEKIFDAIKHCKREN